MSAGEAAACHTWKPHHHHNWLGCRSKNLITRVHNITQISRLRREDVVSYLQAWERPDSSVLGISGAISSARLSSDTSQLRHWRVPSTAAAASSRHSLGANRSRCDLHHIG